MTVCREVDHGVDWAKQRESVDRWLAEGATRLQLMEEPLDPATWGTSPAAQQAQARALTMAEAQPRDGRDVGQQPPG